MRFIMKTEVIAGDGIARDLPKHLVNNSWKRIGLVLDKGLSEKNSYVQEITDLLRNGMDELFIVHCEMPEPTYDYLDKVSSGLKELKIDCFIGIGGGSTLDLTKGLAVMKTNEGSAIEYRGFGKVKNIPLPIVALPSTAGTGSEVTPYAVFIDSQAKWKFGINTEYNYPRVALYDPGLLRSCPLHIFASAGMDAMTHALESFVAKGATSISKLFSKKAVELLYPNLLKIAKGDRAVSTIMDLLLGSGCAGIALMNAGAGPAGALSYPLGVYFDVPHGLAGSVFLPGVIKYNVENGYDKYYELYDIISEGDNLSLGEKSVSFSEKIQDLSNSLGIPVNLKAFGVNSEDDVNSIVDNSMQLKAAFDQNPVIFGKNEIEKLIRSLV